MPLITIAQLKIVNDSHAESKGAARKNTALGDKRAAEVAARTGRRDRPRARGRTGKIRPQSSARGARAVSSASASPLDVGKLTCDSARCATCGQRLVTTFARV